MLVGDAYDYERAVDFEEIDVLIPVDAGGDGVDDEVEGAFQFDEGIGIGGGVEVVGSEALAIGLFL